MKRVSAVVFVGLLTASCPSALAENAPKMEPGEQAKPSESVVDRTHKSVSDYIIETADDLDQNLNRLLIPEEMEPNQTFNRFFGDRNLKKTDSRAQIKLGLGVEWSEIESFGLVRKFSGKIDLPRSEKQLKLVFDNLNEDQDALAGFQRSRSQREAVRDNESGGSASIQATLGKISDIRFTADAGMDFNPEPVPKFKFTAGIPWHWGETEFSFSQRVFWKSDDGFGEKTTFDIKRFFGDSLLIKMETAAVWSETSEGMDLGQTILMRHLIHDDSTVGVLLGARAHTEPKTEMDLYLVRFPFRKSIYKEWIYLVVEPGADFQDDHDWEFSPLISVKTEFYFGRP